MSQRCLQPTLSLLITLLARALFTQRLQPVPWPDGGTT